MGGLQMGPKSGSNQQSGQGTGRGAAEESGVEEQAPLVKATVYESGKIYFISPDDKVNQVAPRSAWQIDLLKTYIDGVLDHMKAQLVSEAQMVTESEKAKKSEKKTDE